MPLVTWDSVNKGSGVTLSNGNLTATIPNYNNTARATISKNSGKWYWEVRLDSGSYAMIGIVNNTAGVERTSNSVNAMYYYNYNGSKYNGTTGSSYGSSYSTGDIISVLLDLDNGTIEFWKNGVSQGVAFTNVKSLGDVYPAITSASSNSGCTFTANFGANPFVYEIPEGYSSYGAINKILILSNSKYKAIDYDDYINVVPILTSNNDSSGIVVNRSTAWSADFEAYKAFDGLTSVSNRWQSASGVTSGWVSIDLKRSVKIFAYKVFNYDATTPPRMAKNWTFEGSNDGANWIVLDTQINQTAWQANEGRLYVLSTPSEYRFFRINISANNGDSTAVTIGELNLLTTNYLIKEIPTAMEQDFINHGMDSLSSIDPKSNFTKKQYIQSQSAVLGSGKTFTQPIDLTRYKVNKISFQ